MYYQKNIEEIIKEFETSEEGLSKKEANERLLKYGKNILTSKKKESILKMFLKEFTSPMILILLFTVVVSFIIGEVLDACVILFIILIDAVIGTYQEYKAKKSAEALNQMLKSKAKVLRDNKEMEIDAEELVVGDIILVDSGTKLTSDARIIECSNIQIDESVLTGESTSVMKRMETIEEKTILAEQNNMLFAGTLVLTGRAKAVVVATSFHTEIGKIASTVANTKEEKSPLTIRMNKFSKQISILIIGIAIISAGLLFIKGYEINAIFLSVVALAVSAMPEGLSLAQTMALTIASTRMSKKNVIVKKLNSVESLGSCTVIASDKTGTLTVNEQTARKILLKNNEEFLITGTGYSTKGDIRSVKGDIKDAERLVRLCAINNEAHYENEKTYHGDSIDIAFLVLNAKMKLSNDFEIVKIIPYESEKQYSAVYYKENGKLRCTIKGSLEKVMSFSEQNNLYLSQNEQLTSEGFRVIAVCDGFVKTIEEVPSNLEFLGMVGFIDPVRREAVKSIEQCKASGIKVLMITGDHPLTSLAIAKNLHLATSMREVATGSELIEYYQKGETEFDNYVKEKTIFSRVTPIDKLHIIESLKRQGEFVAVTGDGVNDAPALKAANIGIAMGSGTDVAKDTASMIIVDDNFTSIVSGIYEGRVAYSNIRKITLFLLSCGMAEVIFFLLAIFFNYDIPLLAIQLLWINVVTDGLQDIALSFEVGSKKIMKEKPRSTKESLFNKELMLEVLIFGLTIAFIIFGVWKYLMDRNVDMLLSRSIVMMLMVFIQNVHVLNCRSEKNSIFTTSLFSNPSVIITIIGAIILQIIVTEVPFLAHILSVTQIEVPTILLLFLMSFIVVVVAEIYKLFYRMEKKKI